MYALSARASWPSAEPVKLHDIAKVIRDLHAERRRIIDEYCNYDPMHTLANITHASHNLHARD